MHRALCRSRMLSIGDRKITAPIDRMMDDSFYYLKGHQHAELAALLPHAVDRVVRVHRGADPAAVVGQSARVGLRWRQDGW
jgi:hypothetical protein